MQLLMIGIAKVYLAVGLSEEEVAIKRCELSATLRTNDEDLERMAARFRPAVCYLLDSPGEMVEAMADVRWLHAGYQNAFKLSKGRSSESLGFLLVSLTRMQEWIAQESISAMQMIIDAVEVDTKADLVMIKKDSNGITKRLNKAFEHGRADRDDSTIEKIRLDMVPELEGRCRRVQLKMAFLCEHGVLRRDLLESYHDGIGELSIVQEQLKRLIFSR